MTLLDRYVIKSFLLALFIFTTSLMGLYIITDAMFQLKRFSQSGNFDFGRLLDYYLAHGPLIVYRLAPFLVLMSAMFTITRMNRAGELIPTRAAGISLYRTCAPMFVLALVIGLGIAAFQEFYVPRLAEGIRSTDKISYIKPPITHDTMGNTFLVKYYHKKTREMIRVRLHHEDAKGSFHINAARAVWESGPRGNGWRLFTGKLYTYDTGGRLVRRENSLSTTLPKEGFFIRSDLLPSALESMRTVAAYLSIGDLARQYRKNKAHHHLKVEIHVRLAYPVTFLVLLLIGLPCVLIPETKNIFLGVGLCLLVCLFYIVVFVFFTEIGNRGTITAMVAAWMPLVLFGSLGITLFDAIRT